MKRGFICAITAVILSVFCRAGQDAMLDASKLAELGLADPDGQINAFRKAFSEPDILKCKAAAAPLFEKAYRDGSFRDVKKFNAVGAMAASRILDTRIEREDPEPSRRFESVEYFMRQFNSCDAVAQTNTYFLKLADYLSRECPISQEGWVEEIKTARRKDRELIAAGAIERPLVTMGQPRTPNLVAVRVKYERIKKWNDAVLCHRKRVAAIFAGPIARYLRLLTTEEISEFQKRFIERAALSSAEETLFFPEKTQEAK